MKAGGGILGLIVVLAALFLPKLLGGGSQHVRRRPIPGRPAERRRGDGRRSARPTSSRSLCGAVDDVSDYWIAEYPQVVRRPVPRGRAPCSSPARRTPAAARRRPDGALLLPGRRARVLRPRLPAPSCRTSSAPSATSPPSTSSPTSTATTCRTCSASAARSAGSSSRTRARPTSYSVALELQADCFAGAWAKSADQRGLLEPGEISEALNAAAAVGDDRIQAAGRHARRPRQFTHGTSEQRVDVVPPRLRHRRPAPLHHVPGAVTRRSAAEAAVEPLDRPDAERRCHQRRRRRSADAASSRRRTPARCRARSGGSSPASRRGGRTRGRGATYSVRLSAPAAPSQRDEPRRAVPLGEPRDDAERDERGAERARRVDQAAARRVGAQQRRRGRRSPPTRSTVASTNSASPPPMADRPPPDAPEARGRGRCRRRRTPATAAADGCR